MRRIVMTLVLVCCGWMAAGAKATVSYSYVTDQSDYSVAPGDTVQVMLFLREVCTDGDPSVLFADGGLLGAGVSVVRFNTVPTSPAAINTILGDGTMSAGSFSSSATDDAASLLEGLNPFDAVTGVTGDDLGGGVRQVLIGTLELTAGSVPGEVTGFSLDRYDTEFAGNTLTYTSGWDLENYDVDLGSPAYENATGSSFTITTVVPVPEPGSLSLLALAGLATLGRRR